MARVNEWLDALSLCLQVICTTGGYLIIIHDLDLINLADDLRGFKVSDCVHIVLGLSA